MKHERLFVWEEDPELKKKESNMQFLWLLLGVIMLFIAGAYGDKILPRA